MESSQGRAARTHDRVAAQAELLADQLRSELGDDAPTVRVSVAAWEPGDTGHDVIGRVRGALAVV